MSLEQIKMIGRLAPEILSKSVLKIRGITPKDALILISSNKINRNSMKIAECQPIKQLFTFSNMPYSVIEYYNKIGLNDLFYICI